MDDGMISFDRTEVEAEMRKMGKEIKPIKIETIEESPLKKFKNIKDIKEEFKKTNLPKGNQLFKIFRKDFDLKEVFVAIVLKPISRYGELELDEKFKCRRIQAYRKLDKLKDLDLIKFLPVVKVREKSIANKNLSEEEKLVLKKWKLWSKSMTEKQKIFFSGKTNYYTLTEKGSDMDLLNYLVNLKYEVIE